ncbi:hypothetical protein R1sor_016546 [Riccia sorocarpa]|uniref:HAT C-terminal dimerisation domain-containing protein n=1 Tax=Riccia sorocarpa TaxID=122646 RepID=A0ABD3HIK1_9MARC
MEIAAYKKDGSNRHIKGCERATESLKFEIRELNARHCGRMAEQNNSANEPSSSGNVRLTEEDREIEQAFPGSILGDSVGTPSACFHNNTNNVRAQHSNFSSPSSIANDSVHSSSQPFESLPPRTQPYIRRTVQLPLKPMMDAAQREKADRLWAMAQQVAGLPFRVFSHPAFQEAYNFSSQFPGYKFPGEKKLRGPLLDANYEAVKEETEKKMFQKLIWDKITISCDGWTNVSGRSQMNILDVNRFGEAVHCHVDGSNEVKSGVWIAGHIKKAIEERGPENVLQFVADNASANTLAGKLMRDTYPHVIFGGCVAHGLDLLMEDIGKFDWVKSVVTECKTFIQFVKNHHMPHAMFLDHFSNGASLLKPAATREGAEHLKTTVLDDEFWDKITGENLRQYLRSVDRELDGIACMDTSIWTQEHREKAMSEECRNAPMLWWAQAGRNAPLLRVIATNILGLTCTTSACERAWSSYGFVHSLARVRLSIPPNPRDAWILDEVLEATGPQIGLSTVENVIYYDDIGDHDFPDDSALQVEDSMVLPGMEIGEEDGLDDYYNISSNWIDQDNIARYTTVDAIDTRKARALGVSENQVVELNKKFGNRVFPKVTLNVPCVTVMSKKIRMLKEIYSMPVERTTTDRASKRPRASSRLKPTNASASSPTREDDRGLGRNVNPRSTDDSSLPRGETSLLTTEPSSLGGKTSSPGGETSSPRADNS